jgi:hypothetical protein
MCRKRALHTLMIALILVSGRGRAAEQVEAVRCIGKVMDAEGLPIARAAVATYEMVSDGLAGDFTLERTAAVATGADGNFTFTVAPKPSTGTRFIWSYVVASKDGSALGWAIWKMREDVTVSLVLGEPATAEGVVVDEAGQPLVGAQVVADLVRARRTAAGEELREWLSGRVLPDHLTTRTDKRGRFVFAGLPRDAAVTYLIAAPGKATIYTQESPQSEQPPALPGQTGVRFILPSEGRISGRILDPDTSQGLAKARFAVVPTSSGLMYYRLACTSDEKGAFAVGGLKSGRYLIRGDGLPHTYVEVRSGETAQVTIRANKPYYGRLLFDNGQPAVVEPAPWPGAQTVVLLAESDRATGGRIGPIDDQGYFRAYLSQEQYQALQSGKTWLYVHLPEGYDPAARAQRIKRETVSAVDLLARDKAKAGVAIVPKPYVEPGSLVGKALPPLDQVGHAARGDRAKDKRLLLCFFDVDQRPSRNCLLQLSREFESLTEQGVIVLAVQASKVEGPALADWLEQSNISLPVGQVAAPEERTRFTWGVTSLPWLILTDRQHVATAEGFGLDEIGDKIKNAAK